MAVRTSQKTGLASDPTVWSGGVVPVEGDSVVIAAGHVVTVDGTYTWGDDTTTAIQVNGTLKASRTVNSSLTCKGHLLIKAGGTFDYGKSADPIPAGVTATVILNYSAALAVTKYGIETQDTAGFWIFGASKKRTPLLTSAVAAGATSIQVSDATGWQVGDRILLTHTTSTSSNQNEYVTIAAGYVSGALTVPVSATSFTHMLNSPAGNMDNNVNVKNYNDTYPGYVYQYWSTAQGANTREIQFATFENLGGTASPNTYGLSFNPNSSIVVTTGCPYIKVANIVALKTVNLNLQWTGICDMTTKQRILFEDCICYAKFTTGGNYGFYEGGGCTVDLYRLMLVAVTPIVSSYSQGGMNVRHYDCWVVGISGANTLYMSGAQVPEFYRCFFYGFAYFMQGIALSGAIFNNCDIGYTFPLTNTNLWQTSAGAAVDATFTDCKFPPAHGLSATTATGLPSTKYVVVNKNGDPSAQEVIVPFGIFARDNVTKNRSASSLRADVKYIGGPVTYSFPVLATNGVPITIIGYLRKNSSYGSATRPSVTVSGLGIVPVSYTMTDVNDIWEKFSLTVTQNSGTDGNLLVSFTAQSSNAAAQAWLDGIPSAPFVTFCRHYGYRFEPTSPTRTVNPYVSASEAAAGAITGIAINGAAKTITVTAGRTLQELYDYGQWWAVQAANMAYAEPLVTTDGATFSSSYSLTLDGAALSGSGSLNLGSGTLTLANGGSSSLTITAADGTHTSITLSSLVAGSRVQLYDVTAGAELYNAVVAGTSLTLPAIWTADHTIRVRVMYVSGATAKAWYETTGILTKNGMSLIVAQVDDPVYNAINVDGSTVTECQIVGTTLVININDPDNTTTAQRLYAFEVYWLSTVGGIRDQALYIDATDSTHFVFEGGLKIKNTKGTPLQITGGNIVPATGPATDVLDLSGGSIFVNFERVEGFAYMTQGGLTQQEHDALLAARADAELARKMQTNRALVSNDCQTVSIYDDDDVTLLRAFLVSADKKARTPA